MNTGSYPTFVTAAPATSFNTCSSANMTQVNAGNKYTNVQQQTATVNTNTIVNTSNTSGQVVALLNSDEAGVTYLRPLDSNGFAVNLAGVGSSNQQGQIFTIPITVPGSKPGEQSQTIQIQVVGQGGISGDKLLPVFGPVLQLAYNQQQDNGSIQLQLQQEGDVSNDQIHNNNNDSMQSSDLLQEVQDDQDMIQDVKPVIIEQSGTDTNGMPFPLAVVVNQDMRRNQQDNKNHIIGDQKDNQADKRLRIQNEQDAGNQYVMTYSSNVNNPVSLADYISMNHDNIPLGHFLKFSPDNTKRESLDSSGTQNDGNSEMIVFEESNSQEKSKRKKKYKKKPPATRKPRPGQIHIATALDGTLLFCCPECSMAYPDKEMLEQHLVAHKIERRFICDLCGAGLKRKEHLERHKLGHNPERPFVCNVCCKGFKRKEHLNLHAVIHSGVKTEVCQDCGKGFYRRDHLRKHTQSHITKRLKEEHAALQQMAEQATSSDCQKISVPELVQNQSHSGPIINLAHQEMIIDAVASGRNCTPSPPNDHQIVITKVDQKLTEQELILLQQQQQQIQHQQQQQQQQQHHLQQPNSPNIAQQEMIIEAVNHKQHQSPSPPQVDHHQVVITKLETGAEDSRENESIILTQSDAREALGLLHHQPQ